MNVPIGVERGAWKVGVPSVSYCKAHLVSSNQVTKIRSLFLFVVDDDSAVADGVSVINDGVVEEDAQAYV
jgi:hypothetical protein